MQNIFTITTRIATASAAVMPTYFIHFNVSERNCARTFNLMLHHIGCAFHAHTLTCSLMFFIIQYQANGKQTDYMFFLALRLAPHIHFFFQSSQNEIDHSFVFFLWLTIQVQFYLCFKAAFFLLSPFFFFV